MQHSIQFEDAAWKDAAFDSKMQHSIRFEDAALKDAAFDLKMQHSIYQPNTRWDIFTILMDQFTFSWDTLLAYQRHFAAAGLVLLNLDCTSLQAFAALQAPAPAPSSASAAPADSSPPPASTDASPAPTTLAQAKKAEPANKPPGILRALNQMILSSTKQGARPVHVELEKNQG